MTSHLSAGAEPRTVDHLVLPVIDIDSARERYTRMGFTVAPDGKHPFGTENCCIFLPDDTFLEPLAVAHRETCEAEAKAGHTFMIDDQAFRFRRGDEGFSHMVLKSQDAKADHAYFKQEGVGGGDMVSFSRNFDTPEGQNGTIAFHLAFAADRRAPDARFFTVQVADAPKVDRSALQTHANGVTGLKEVILSETNPTDFQYFFQTYLNQRYMDADSFGMSFETPQCRVSVLSPEGMQVFHGLDVRDTERGLLFQTFVLEVKSLATTRALFDANKVDYHDNGKRLTVAPAGGQGCPILFEEAA